MTLEGWSEFNVAVAGAAAALAGLLIVALSVNVAVIAKTPSLSARASSAIGTLVLAVVATMVGLIPAQPLWVIGLEIGVGLVVAWVMQVHTMRVVSREDNSAARRAAKTIPGLLPLVAFTLGCIMLLLGNPGGFYAVAAGAILAIINAVVFSWVALVEVLR
jgi:hypothetical protein